MTIETATIFRTWIDIAEAMKTDAERGRFYHAVCRYAVYDELPRLEGLLQAYFTLIQPSLDKSKKRKIAQQNGLQIRLQNGLQNGLQNKRQKQSQKAPQTEPQTDSQTAPTRALKTGTVIEKKTGSKDPSKEKFSFVDQLPPHLLTDAVKAKWKEWEDYRRSKRKPISPAAFSLMRTMLEKLDPAEAIESINQSIASDWQGLFPPKQQAQRITPPNARKDITGI